MDKKELKAMQDRLMEDWIKIYNHSKEEMEGPLYSLRMALNEAMVRIIEIRNAMI